MRIAVWILAAAALLAAGPFVLERLLALMIFQPSRGVDLRPADLGIDASEVWVDTEDGVRIHGFFVPGAEERRRAVLFLHGNAGNASHRLPNAAALAQLGSDVLVLDYRGYGLSEGRPSEAGVYADARAGLAHLVNERGLPEERIVLFGRSLGGAIALDLAQDRKLAGVIVESTFPSVKDIARSMVGALGAALGRGFDSESKLGRLQAPLLVFHGDRDTLIPHALGRKLFDAAPEPKAFETIAGAGHNDTVQVGGLDYLRRIGRFLDEVAP